MYRLINLRNSAQQKLLGVSFANNSDIVHSSFLDQSCNLCKILRIKSKDFVRLQSTIPNPLSKTKKARKKRTKNYAELLVVRDNKRISQRKASVQNLKPCEINLLASSNINLGELYKLKEMSLNNTFVEPHTYNNLIDTEIPITSTTEFNNYWFKNLEPLLNSPNTITCDITSGHKSEFKLPDLQNSLALDLDSTSFLVKNNFIPDVATIIEQEVDILDDFPVIKNTFQPEVIEDEPTIEHETSVDSEELKIDLDETSKTKPKTNKKVAKPSSVVNQKAREEIIAKTLAAYVETCSNAKVPLRGLTALYSYRSRVKRKKQTAIKNINVYNGLLKGFAAKSDIGRFREVLNIIKEENIALNVQSYVAAFECFGRININDKYLEELKGFVKQAKENGISLRRILNEGIFLNDEREVILKTFRAVYPDFVANYYKPQVQYNNELVNGLNHDSQLVEPKLEYVHNNGLFTPENLNERINRQLEMERGGFVTVKSIEQRGKPTEDTLAYRKTLEDHYQMWEEEATKAFQRDLMSLTAKRNPTNHDIYLRSIPLKDYIKIIIDEAKKMAQGSETYSPTVGMLHRDLGFKVYARYKVLRKQKTGVLDKVKKIHSDYCMDYANQHDKLDVLPKEEVLLNSRQRWQWIDHKHKAEGASLLMGHQAWPPTILQDIGKFLYHIVMHDIKIDVNSMKINYKHKNFLPAFYTIFRTQGRITKEEVKPHPVLAKLYRASVPETLSFLPYEVPMVCPPVPWISVHMGGYLISPCDMVRLPVQATTQRHRLVECRNNIYPSLDALNQLGAMPWKVNQRILDTILEVFNAGGSSKLDVPEPPSSLKAPATPTSDMEKTERYQLFRQKLAHRRKKAEMYSLWCDCLYRLSLANHFRDDMFWLPHNMDFRGRVYPVPPHLNHLGSDLARSMLVFAESRPLGPDGLDWLKVHLINLTGLKKRDPVSERLKYADEIMQDILDSADNPLKGAQWWAKSDEPWQTLACCMEIAEAIRSPDPTKFRSHFPIHQDGSCNGLQHYAALGRDSAGAYSVNLCPSDVPQDVYSAVVYLVEEQRMKDAENGVEVAKALAGFVKRKVIKQTIMTTVYGVTRFGARLQIAKQLKDIDNFPKDLVWNASSYLTGRTFDSLRTMFTSTREIQDWFTECARLISSVSGQFVEWVTPLGLPIVQPYFRYKKLGTAGVGNMCAAFHMDSFEKPNVMKQKNAFPPNFIHSLDSSHMMLTSLHSERAGITFVSVHDCYWTHPSTVHIMNEICRQQFVALHSQPILEDLSIFLSNKYSFADLEENDEEVIVQELSTKKKLNKVLRDLPATGDFDINEVLRSVYFFS